MQFYTTDDVPANLVSESFAANIMRKYPRGSAQIFALSGLAKPREITTIDHGWYTQVQVFPKFTINAAVTSASATTLQVTDPAALGVKVGSIFRWRPLGGSVEQVRVTALDATTVTVTRGFANTTALANIPAGTEFHEVGSAYGQGSDVPTPRVMLPSRYINNTSIIRDAWDVTGTLAATKLKVGENPVQKNRTDAMFFHAQAIEKAILFSRKGVTTDPATGQLMTTCAGIEQIIEDNAAGNIREAGATTTFTQLEAMLDPMLDYRVEGETNSMYNIYCGATAFKVFNEIGRLSGMVNLTPSTTEFGLRFTKFRTTRGDYNLIEHPMFNTNNEMKKAALILDTNAFDIMYLAGRKTFHTEYGMKERAGKDAQGGVFTTEFTIEMQNPFSCGMIYNLTAGA